MIKFITCKLCGETLLCHSYAHWLRKHRKTSMDRYLSENDISKSALEGLCLGSGIVRESKGLPSVIKLKKKRKSKKWLSEIKRIKDTKLRRLTFFQEGYTDKEIAEHEGITPKGIASYRRYIGLEPNIKGG